MIFRDDFASYPSLRVAISAARLEHVTRGVETWARDTFEALSERGVDVTLYKGSGKPRSEREHVLPSVKKGSRLSALVLRLAPRFCWRFGLGSGDGLEETTFALGLIREIRRNSFDIVHMQDAHVAARLQSAFAKGRIRARVILGHGTEEPATFLDRFPYLQHLAPYHLDETLGSLSVEASMRPFWYAIPNFVDTDVFRPPCGEAEKQAFRLQNGIPADAFVVLCVAAIKKGHKRIDHLIREMASISDPRLHLVVAGAKEADTESLMKMAASMMGSRVRLLCDLTHDRMAEVYRSADVFALCSLKEMMPIALLEALSTGLPAVVHTYPVLEWMTGEGGVTLDMNAQGDLVKAVSNLIHDPAKRETLGRNARVHAIRMFSKDAVVRRIMEMYKEIVSA